MECQYLKSKEEGENQLNKAKTLDKSKKNEKGKR